MRGNSRCPLLGVISNPPGTDALTLRTAGKRCIFQVEMFLNPRNDPQTKPQQNNDLHRYRFYIRAGAGAGAGAGAQLRTGLCFSPQKKSLAGAQILVLNRSRILAGLNKGTCDVSRWSAQPSLEICLWSSVFAAALQHLPFSLAKQKWRNWRYRI